MELLESLLSLCQDYAFLNTFCRMRDSRRQR